MFQYSDSAGNVLERYRHKDGSFVFKLKWHGSGLAPLLWRQHSNPVISGVVEGYEWMSGDYTFAGLRSTKGESLMEGQGAYRHCVVGSCDGCLLGPCQGNTVSLVNMVELSVQKTGGVYVWVIH